jgi:hypothetical protein
MIVSHKKMKEIKDKINELYIDNDKNEEFFSFLKEILKYDENFKYVYKKEDYEKYKKPYYEKNKEKINAQTAANAKKRYNEKKNLKNEN